MENKMDKYIDFINENILPYIDYRLLGQSCEILKDKSYAKAVLNELTVAARNIYGSTVRAEYNDDDFILVPGIVQSKHAKILCIALLELDLSSSGERWGTDFLSKFGIISSNNTEELSNNGKIFLKVFSSCDYAYTLNIPGDIHLEYQKLTDKAKMFLDDYSNHFLPLPYKNQEMNLPDDEESEDQEI